MSPHTNTNATAGPGTPPAHASDLLDCDLNTIRDHLAAAYATRSVMAMWACCQDEAGLLGDVDRLTTEVGRLRHDFATISDDLDAAAAQNAALTRDNRDLILRLTALRIDRDALNRKTARLTRLLGAELVAQLDAARTRAALADADAARLVRAARAALATGDLAYVRAEFDRRGIGADNGHGRPLSGPAALAAPIPGQRRGDHDGPAAA